jgi:hypothetical protein
LEHCIRLAASRAAWTAGNRRAINTPIIAITTRSSTRVNARKPTAEGGLRKIFAELSLRKFVKIRLPAPPPLTYFDICLNIEIDVKFGIEQTLILICLFHF